MLTNLKPLAVTERFIINSQFLQREVKVDCYLPAEFLDYNNLSLLLINDGQDLVTMHFEKLLGELYKSRSIHPLFCVGIHCSTDRKNEYGTAKYLDYKGRGAKASLYSQFIFTELIPFLKKQFSIVNFADKSFAGFSLGALSALDIVWNNPAEFKSVGVFSLSLIHI